MVIGVLPVVISQVSKIREVGVSQICFDDVNRREGGLLRNNGLCLVDSGHFCLRGPVLIQQLLMGLWVRSGKQTERRTTLGLGVDGVVVPLPKKSYAEAFMEGGGG